jgi:flagellar hook protein FlgE
MLRGMYSAISGLKMHQSMLDVTANDIANVNTIGYKGSRTTFTDQLAQLQSGASAPTIGGMGGRNPAQVGLGVQFGSIDNVMGGGALQSTSNVLDLAVQGEGWFRIKTAGPATAGDTAVADPAGADAFTRAGNFTRNADGYLTTQGGAYLLGTKDGAPAYLRVPDGAQNMTISAAGEVTYVPNGGGARESAGFLTLATFANEGGLERASTNLWKVSAASGPEVIGDQNGLPGTSGRGSTVSGVVEMSNVDLATEFTNMITAQRGFQANSRVIGAADEMLTELVNMKR